MFNWKTALGVTMFAVSIMGTALAQAQTPAAKGGTPIPAAPASPPPIGEPVQTTATYGDWVLRCVRTGDAGTGPQTCEVVQTIVLANQTQPIAQIAIGSVDKTSGLRLTVVVPTAVSFSKQPFVTGAPGMAALFDLTWRRCLPGGCYADFPLNADTLKILRARTEPANLVFKDASERDVTLPFAMRGLSQALEALPK